MKRDSGTVTNELLVFSLISAGRGWFMEVNLRVTEEVAFSSYEGMNGEVCDIQWIDVVDSKG